MKFGGSETLGICFHCCLRAETAKGISCGHSPSTEFVVQPFFWFILLEAFSWLHTLPYGLLTPTKKRESPLLEPTISFVLFRPVRCGGYPIQKIDFCLRPPEKGAYLPPIISSSTLHLHCRFLYPSSPKTRSPLPIIG